jgi:hypothetical protein
VQTIPNSRSPKQSAGIREHQTSADREMHFLTSLIIIGSLTVALGFALVKLIGDLSTTSVHVPPDIQAMSRGTILELEPEHAKAIKLYESSVPE